MKIEIDYRCQCSPGYRISKGCRWCSPQDTIYDLEEENADLVIELKRLENENNSLETDLDNINRMVVMYFDAIENGLNDSDIEKIRFRLEGLAE